MNIRKIAKYTGGVVVLLVAVVAGTGAYANATWDKGRYSDYPLPDLHATTDSATIERGRYLVFGPAHCADCHSPESQHERLHRGEEVALSGGLDFGIPFGHMYSPNLTPDKQTGIGRWTDPQLARMIRYNVRPHGRAAVPFMQFERMSDDDVVAVISYLRAQPPVRNEVKNHELNTTGHAIAAFLLKPNSRDNDAPRTAPASAPTVERGEYLVNSVAECAGCHTKRSMRDGSFIGPRLGGGNTEEKDGLAITPPNLTNDPTGITGRWSEDQFVARFRGGRLVKQSIMPWEAFAKINDDDLRAIYRYIRSVPSVQNSTPSVQKTN